MIGTTLLVVALQVCGSLGCRRTELVNHNALHGISENFNGFAKDLYQKIAKGEDGNFVVSPISVSTILSMLAIGSSGKTRNQLTHALHFGNHWADQHREIKPLLENFNNFSSVDLKLANQIFISDKVGLHNKFGYVSKLFYKTAPQSIDYSDPRKASRLINKWCRKQTRSKIRNMVTPDDFDMDTVMVLLNAVYFKGNWAEKFRESDTKKLPFNLENGTTKNVPTMFRSGFYRVGSLPRLKARFVQLPYENADKNDGLSMVIIIPTNRLGFRNLEKNLLKLNVKDFSNGEITEILLYLPKFKIESKIDLKTPLNELGLTEIFGPTADFQNLVTTRGVAVSKIAQKAFIEVNEEGSEAAAVTNLGLQNRFSGDSNGFMVNQPFVALIATNHSILFMSRILEP